MLLHVVITAEEAWPKVLGGGVAYFVHTVFHGLYHRIGHFAMRAIGRGGDH